MAESTNYDDWSRDRLVERVKELEQQLQKHKPGTIQNQAATPAAAAGTRKEKKRDKKTKKMDPAKYSTRLIALKLAYLGKRYGGFEYQPGSSTPSIEEELWKALVRSCLIWPEQPDKVDFGPWEYSKCGRTDKGVSAFGQVIGIRVRSNRPVVEVRERDEGGRNEKGDADAEMAEAEGEADVGEHGRKPAWDPIADEINYPKILNRLLPPDIRVLAWAPTLPPDFSARFSCWERQYRYFFTQPAFAPLPGSLESSKTAPGGTREGWLDIAAMREAAKLFEGVHDFRNFCKIDGSKQITNFTRRVFEADIVEVDNVGSALPYLSQQDFRPPTCTGEGYPKVYYFHVRGSAFLWHQIRHMVAILFAVGQGLEKPSLVTELLDVSKQPRKPNYVMAEEVPLVLWDCIFPKVDEDTPQNRKDVHDPDSEGDVSFKDGIDWIWLGEDQPSNLHGASGLVNQLWEYWRERKMDELLASQLLDSVARKPDLSRRLAESGPASKQNDVRRVFEGGNTARPTGAYVPVLKRPLMASPEEVNDKWAQSKGFANAEELASTKNWRSVIKAAKNGGGSSSSNAAVDNSSSVDE
jgi:tRNA pseudouridine38/39 synthase